MKDSKVPLFKVGETLDTLDDIMYEILNVYKDDTGYVYGVVIINSISDYLLASDYLIAYEEMSEGYICLELGY